MPANENARLRKLLSRFGLPIDPPALGADRYLELMARDKKVEGGTLRLVLLRALGQAVIVRDVSRPKLKNLLEVL